jgi:hypothetical protein
MSISYNPGIVTSGLVLCLDAANTKSYPGSGTVWTDVSGNGNTGTLVNGPTYSSSNLGSIVFDGVNDYASVNVNSFIRSNSAYTFNSFFYYSAGGSGSAPYSLMTYPSDANNNDGFWQHLNLGGTFYWRTEDSVAGETGGTIGASSPFSDSNWYYLTTVVKTNGLIYYLNGVLFATISNTFAWANVRNDNVAYLYIGAGYGEAYPFAGKIPYFSLHNKELSAAEVTQNFNALRGRYGI